MTDQNAPSIGAEGNQNYSEAMLVILGAGASHDCLPSSGQTANAISSTVIGARYFGEFLPPLTQELAGPGLLTGWFAERWEAARPVISFLGATLAKALDDSGEETAQSMESALRDYEERSQRDPTCRRHLLGLSFYLRDLFTACTEYVHAHEVGGGDTNQLRLLGQVRQWGGRKPGRTVTFVSLNYDMILERAMKSQSQFDPLKLSDYVNDRLSRLLKPHGSANWNWGFASASMPNGGPTRDLGNHAINKAMTEDVNRARLIPLDFDYRLGAKASLPEDLIPALALPMDGKNEFVWPSEQREAFNQLDGRVTRLMTIGWRALEPHFVPLLGPLIHPSCKVLVVAGGPDGEREASTIFQRLQKTINSSRVRWHTYGEGFTGLLERSGELEWFLRD